MKDAAFTVTDDTPVVATKFRVVPGDHGGLTALLRQARAATPTGT